MSPIARTRSTLALLALVPLAGACRSSVADAPDAPPTAADPALADPSAPTIVEDDLERALELAREGDRLVLVEFTAHNCVNCRMMEVRVLAESPLAEELAENYVEARLHVDAGEQGEAHQALQRNWASSLVVPTYVVLDPATREVLAIHRGLTEGWKLQALLADARR